MKGNVSVLLSSDEELFPGWYKFRGFTPDFPQLSGTTYTRKAL